MNPNDETFDVVNEQDRVIGQASRAEVHARRLRHRAVHVLLINHRQELFVQKRSGTKDTHPHRYDSSASGHVDSGEEYDSCAVRELREELSLALPASAFKKLFKIEAAADTDWEFIWIYAIHGDHEPTINPAEIEAGAFWPMSAVERLVKDHPDQCAPAFCRIVREIRSRGLRLVH